MATNMFIEKTSKGIDSYGKKPSIKIKKGKNIFSQSELKELEGYKPFKLKVENGTYLILKSEDDYSVEVKRADIKLVPTKEEVAEDKKIDEMVATKEKKKK